MTSGGRVQRSGRRTLSHIVIVRTWTPSLKLSAAGMAVEGTEINREVHRGGEGKRQDEKCHDGHQVPFEETVRDRHDGSRMGCRIFNWCFKCRGQQAHLAAIGGPKTAL